MDTPVKGMNNRNDPIVTELLDRIAALEINNQELREEVELLNNTVDKVVRTQQERKHIKGRSVAGKQHKRAYPADEHQRAREGI